MYYMQRKNCVAAMKPSFVSFSIHWRVSTDLKYEQIDAPQSMAVANRMAIVVNGNRALHTGNKDMVMDVRRHCNNSTNCTRIRYAMRRDARAVSALTSHLYGHDSCYFPRVSNLAVFLT